MFLLFAGNLPVSTEAAPDVAEHWLPNSLEIEFVRISGEDGLSHPEAKRIIQDSHGFIWVGTQQGLNRYDGYTFEIFNSSADEPGSLSKSWVFDILEDRDGRIWVATDGGLDLFEANSKTFSHFRHSENDPSSLPHDTVKEIFQSSDGSIWVGTPLGLSRLDDEKRFVPLLSYPRDPKSMERTGVRAIAEDGDGYLWIGTQTEGVIRLDPETGQKRQFDYGNNGENSIGGPYVRSLLIDSEGEVWVGTRNHGIARISGDGSIHRFEHDPYDEGSLSSNHIWRIYEDKQQRVWVGTDYGLNLWLPNQNRFQRYKHDATLPASLVDDRVYDVMQDRGNVIWVGTANGISRWNPSINTFSQIKRDNESPSTISNNQVSSFAEANDGNIWVGTIGGGVNLWSIRDNRFKHFENGPAEGSLSDNMVMSLMQDTEGHLWAGTMSRGLNRLDPETEKFEHFRFDKNDFKSISSNSISSLLQDSAGRIWIGTYGGGLNLYLGDGLFQRFPRENTPGKDFPSYFLVDIEEAPDGKLWLASDGGGVMRFDPETESVEVMRQSASSENSISENVVITLLQTSDSLWAGTRESGLNRYKDGSWSHFGFKQGLPSKAIYGLLEDESGRIWISHSKGISSLEPATGAVTNYNTIHGLQGSDFNNGAFLKTADGKMMFGGANGFNIFYPSQVQVNTSVPPVKLTRFTKFNKEVLLDKPAYDLDAIELSYDDYVVGFEFSALDFTDPARNQYRYMLAGFDREWVDAKNLRQATYTNLGPGDYTFRVQGSNNDGIWNEEGLSVDLKVSPAPWATWWAMALYTMVAIAVVYGTAQAYSVRLHREEQRRYSEQLEALVAERTSALENEITDHKTAQLELSRSLQEKEVLLKEVHHRVKNNMQVISSLLNIQADSVMDERFQTLLTESQQRIKSMALIHENLYRSESLLEINFHEYIQMLTHGLVRFYRFSNLVVHLDLDVKDIFLDIDTAVPCGLIINELVSNSLKHGFTGREGKGQIHVGFAESQDGKTYRFSVRDDGNGIDPSIDIENATSMGLEIVRILTEQLDGQWTYRSDSGADFTVEFPRKN